jgi:hypothetical protein
LSNKLGQWIRDELLLKEAYQRNLQGHTDVLQDKKEIKQRNSYQYLLSRELDNIIVPQEIQKYFDQDKNEQPISNRRLSRFHTLQEWQWWQAEIILHKKIQNYYPEIFIDEELLQKENSHIDWKNRISLFMIRKPS